MKDFRSIKFRGDYQMFKKKISLLICAVMTLSMLGGCSNKTETPSKPETSSKSETTTTETKEDIKAIYGACTFSSKEYIFYNTRN